MDNYLAGLATEGVNPETQHIDACTTEEMVELINRQDALVAGAVGAERHHIAQAVDLIYGCFRRGGRLIYLGAGTSGRLGVLDASECVPTFGVDPDMVQGYIAGGDVALRHPVEGCEDSEADGVALVDGLNVVPTTRWWVSPPAAAPPMSWPPSGGQRSGVASPSGCAPTPGRSWRGCAT